MSVQPAGLLHGRGILNRDQLANELGIKPQTVADWQKRGMPIIKEGMTIFYDLDDVIMWMRKRSKNVKR